MLRYFTVFLSLVLFLALPVSAEQAGTLPAPSEMTDAENPEDALEGTFTGAVVDKWEEEGLLEDMTYYTDLDLLDYYGIDLTMCQAGTGFADAVGYTNEAVLIEADEDVCAEILKLLEAHVEQVKATFRSYDPEALALAEKAVLVSENGRVLLIISPQAETMLKLYEEMEDAWSSHR